MSITTISARKIKLENSNTPDFVGPGSYDPHVKDLSVRSPISMEIPFGSTTRRELFNLPENEDVGPGKYDPQLIVKGASPKYDFASFSKRDYFVDYEKTPSPAEYSQITNWGVVKNKEPAQWQHPVNHKNLSSARKRGPSGLGNLEINQDNGSNLSNFGRALDNLDEMNKKPSKKKVISTKLKMRPGTRTTDFGRSKTPQREVIRYNGVPGPAQYNVEPVKKQKKGKSPMFYPTPREAVFTVQKNPNETMLSHKAWCNVTQCAKAFGTGSNREIEFYIPETPGVGKYEINPKKKQKKSVDGFGINRLEERSQTPGPGYYNLTKEDKKFVGNGKRSKRGELWTIVETPAPNEYNVDTQEVIERKSLLKTSTPVFVDKSKRYELENSETNPGPVYNTRPKSQVRGGFSKAARFKQDSYIGQKISTDPSPAEYNVERNERISGGVIRRNAHEISDKSDTPGPGRYGTVKSELSRPSYNIMYNKSLQKTIPH